MAQAHEVQREVIHSGPPGGTEVWKFPQLEARLPAFYGPFFVSWVAYLNQEDSFVERYADHVALTRNLLVPPAQEDTHNIPAIMKEKGISLEGILLYSMKGSPKLYMPIEGTGNVIGHIAGALWSHKDGMTPKEIGLAMRDIFKTWPGQQVIQDAQSMGMIAPPLRGKGWDLPVNATQVIGEFFTGKDKNLLPTLEGFKTINEYAGVVYEYQPPQQTS